VVERRAMVDGIRHVAGVICWMRREGGRLSDLVGIQPARFGGRDFLIGLAYAAGILPFAMLGGFLGTALIYGSAPGPQRLA
jgi:hypothetical protein